MCLCVLIVNISFAKRHRSSARHQFPQVPSKQSAAVLSSRQINNPRRLNPPQTFLLSAAAIRSHDCGSAALVLPPPSLLLFVVRPHRVRVVTLVTRVLLRASRPSWSSQSVLVTVQENVGRRGASGDEDVLLSVRQPSQTSGT